MQEFKKKRSRPGGPRRSLFAFARREDGSAAVEFGFIALPFFALLFATIEIALHFFAGQILETGVQNASRLIRTGQAQEQGFSKEEFRKRVCETIYGILDCDNSILLDVRTYKDFSAAKNVKEAIKDGKVNVDEKFDPGDAGEIVVVRAFIEYPTIVPGLGQNLADLENGNSLLISTVAFRNEPF
ncbi:MAG: TadE/TadG family type IV pilus assembly protein [Pseudomonadota bacterium]